MALEMNPEIRARWTAALRSGTYKQGEGYLRINDGYCCFGVLCELAVKARIIHLRQNDNGIWQYDGRADYLPEAVLDWAGLRISNPEVSTPSGMFPLAILNDGDDETEGQWSFAQIADAIDGGAS